MFATFFLQLPLLLRTSSIGLLGVKSVEDSNYSKAGHLLKRGHSQAHQDENITSRYTAHQMDS